MVTYVNIGPYKSGSTSFYNMCCKYNGGINTGKIKEPLLYWFVRENKKFDINIFLSNWNINYENDIILDGSGDTGINSLTLNFKQETSTIIDYYKFIVLIRNPINYYSSRLFFSLDLTTDFNPTIDNINKLKTLVRNKLCEKEFFIFKSYWYYIEKIKERYSKNSIFILPIDYFENYKDQLSDFLLIDIKEFELKKQRSKMSSKYILIKSIIKGGLLQNKKRLDFIYNELKLIDEEYNSNLSKLYPRRIK